MLDLPRNYDRLRVIGCQEEFFAASFDGRVNCMIHPRNLSGDFNGLARCLYKPGATWFDQNSTQRALRDILEDQARHDHGIGLAARCVINDIDTIESMDLRADLRVIGAGYYADDVYRFHVDSDFENPENKIGHIFCPYTERTTDFLRNEDAVFDGMTAYCTTLYKPKIPARFYSVPVGSLVRHMFDRKQAGIAGFIHAAPAIGIADAPRLFLVGVQHRIP